MKKSPGLKAIEDGITRGKVVRSKPISAANQKWADAVRAEAARPSPSFIAAASGAATLEERVSRLMERVIRLEKDVDHLQELNHANRAGYEQEVRRQRRELGLVAA
jgi:hypothetical protein